MEVMRKRRQKFSHPSAAHSQPGSSSLSETRTPTGRGVRGVCVMGVGWVGVGK